MATKLKNYTTEVPAFRSILNIEDLLIKAGASNIMKEYTPGGSGQVEAISFIIEVKGLKLPFRLPGKVKECYLWLKKRSPKSQDKTLLTQAERITWKQLNEWVHLTLSQIELDQMETLEAFFPFLYDIPSQTTYYERIKKGEFRALIENRQS